MSRPFNPKVVYHADWSSTAKKRWCAKAVLSTDGRYTASAPEPVGPSSSLIEWLRMEAGDAGCAFAGFDFPIGLPASYAKHARITRFRSLLPKLGRGKWKDFYSVCDRPDQISVHRPFYPKGAYKGRHKEDLFHGHGVSSVESLLRLCERGGAGQRQACCLFWTLGSNQVGKAAIIGWRDVLAPALRGEKPISLWPFDGPMSSLVVPESVVVAETYPAECYGWFSDEPLGSKRNQADRKKFGASLLLWASAHSISLLDGLRKEIRDGFPQGKDDAFDAVVGLFGILNVCLGQRDSGEPDDYRIRRVEGWILGRKP